MRIDSNPLSLAQSVAQTAPADQAAAQQARTGSRTGSGDQVRISDVAAGLSTDPSRLAQLTAAVRSGAYNISPSQLANSMISYALQT